MFTYLVVSESVEDQVDDLGNLFQLPVEEALLVEFIVHLLAELDNALRMSV